MAITGIGQRLKTICYLVNSGQVSSLPTFCEDGKYDCNFMIPVFADDTANELRNDKSSILGVFQSWVLSAEFILQKNESSVWIDKDTIIDDTYGEFYDIGDFESQPYYAGVVIYWANVLSAFSVGEYRLKITETNPLGENITYSKTFCLKEYGCDVNNSVRIEWYNNYGLGDINNDTLIVDFTGMNWYNQIRLPHSIFAYPRLEYTLEEIQFTNGKFQDVTNKQEQTYTLKIGAIPAWLHHTLGTYCFQAAEAFITDYSNNNPEEIIGKSCKLKSTYAPRWKQLNKCAPVTLELKPTYNRREQWKCLTNSSFST